MNQFLATLVRLNHSRTSLALIAFFLISSCGLFGSKQEKFHAQVFCPELGVKTLIQDITAADFLEALNGFHNYKQQYLPTADYTTLIFSNGYSMQFKAKSEEVLKCIVTDVRWTDVGHDYTY